MGTLKTKLILVVLLVLQDVRNVYLLLKINVLHVLMVNSYMKNNVMTHVLHNIMKIVVQISVEHVMIVVKHVMEFNLIIVYLVY